MATEKNFELKVRKFLDSEGCYEIKFFANGYTKSGIPDVLACCNGYFVGVEVKAPKGTPSELQKRNIKKIQECSGIALVLYPDQFEDFKRLVNHLMCDELECAWRIERQINERWND